jgi:DNA primase large subunit
MTDPDALREKVAILRKHGALADDLAGLLPEDAREAFYTLTSMYSHRGDGIPTQFIYPTEVRAAASVLAARIAELQARIERLKGALEFIADTPDPGEEKERTATFYRVHAAMLKQVAAKAIGRQTVSQEALDWAESVYAEIEAARAALGRGE